jgi:hypothetical protein
VAADTAEVVIATKLFRPNPRYETERARLHDLLRYGYTLTLIVALAGWGKSTLVADWLAHDLREQMRELADRGAVHLIADLGQVDFLGATGLGALVGGLKRLREADGSLPLVTVRARFGPDGRPSMPQPGRDSRHGRRLNSDRYGEWRSSWVDQRGAHAPCRLPAAERYLRCVHEGVQIVQLWQPAVTAAVILACAHGLLRWSYDSDAALG